MNIGNDIIDDGLQEKNKDQISLPYEGSIFIKGLLGMILCIAPGAFIGLILIKMCLDQSKIAEAEYILNVTKYKPESIKKIYKGRTMAYIGLFLFILELIALMCII